MADIPIFEILADISISVIFYSLHRCRHCLLKSSIGQAPLLFTSLKSYLQQLLFLIKCSGESGIQMLNCKNWQLHQKLPIESLSHPTFSVKLGQCFPKVCVPKVALMSLFCFHTFASRGPSRSLRSHSVSSADQPRPTTIELPGPIRARLTEFRFMTNTECHSLLNYTN